MKGELRERRVLRHPCWCLTSARRGANGPAQQRFCHNERCWLLGLRSSGRRPSIVIHSQKERRYRCKRCGRTFSTTKGTALYRAHKPHELVATVITLLAYGCPVQAIVAAFALDERTIHR